MSVELELAALELAQRAKVASRELLRRDRQKLVLDAAEEIVRRAPAILGANEVDLANAKGQTPAFIDRLRLDRKRLGAMAAALREVAALPDPVGEVVESQTRPNGLRVDRVRAPLGVILMIYESRPNVTAEAAALCLRSGNAALLRGGSEALQTNSAIAACFPEDAVQLVPPDRALLDALLQLDEHIDLCIPRGGPSLIRFIAERSRVPVIKHYQGVCHLYVAADADLAMAERLAVNGKVQRPGVCNALECLLVDARVAQRALPPIASALRDSGVELRCDERALPLVKGGIPAMADDFGREFLDLKLAVAVVDGVEGALRHIARYGSRHTEAIVTSDAAAREAVPRRGGRKLRALEREHAVQRRRRAGARRRDRNLHQQAARVRPDGPAGADLHPFVVQGDGQVRT